jgi:hypothetical protein
MIVAISLPLVVALLLARRAMEPRCPACSAKRWAAHSTQLQCAACGWNNGARPAPRISQPEAPQYEMGLG